MHTQEHPEPLAENRFHFGPFYFWTALQLSAALGLFYWIAPETFRAEFTQPWAMLGWTFAFGIPLSLFEYFYHRYLLHSAVLPFLGMMHTCHAEHHGLTNVKAPITQKEPEKLVEVHNEYPIEHEHQEESMQFPYFSISIFFLIFITLVALPFKAMLPNQPVIAGMMFTVTLAYSAYELWHAVLHLPIERYWKPWMEHKTFGGAVRHVYGFHLMHHWRPITNQAVVGFWGFAMWDHLFRTHHRPGRMPLDKAHVNYNDAAIPKPRWPVNVIDKMQPKLYKTSRKVESAFLKMFGFKRQTS